jgi:membrane protease subunit HflC
MKNIAITIFIVLIVLALSLYLITFQVRETESCMVTTFGKPTRQITEPGWFFKWPFPIQQVHTFDSRMRVFTPEVEETRTAGGHPIIVNTYVVWRISEPLKFYNSVQTVKNAENELLRSRIRNTQNNVIGLHDFSEFVNSDQEKIQIEQIEEEMLTQLQQDVDDADYGIEIKTLGIKQLKVNEDVSKAVFERMKTDRDRRAQKITSEGDSEAIRIRTVANSMRDELVAAADARAKEIRGEGDARAAEFFEMLEDDPKLAMFLRELEALQVILATRTTFVVPTEKSPFNLLEQKPDIKPVDPNTP